MSKRFHKRVYNNNKKAAAQYAKRQAKQAAKQAKMQARQASYELRQAEKSQERHDFIFGDGLDAVPYRLRSFYADTEAAAGAKPIAAAIAIILLGAASGYLGLEMKKGWDKYDAEKDAHSKTKADRDKTKKDLTACENNQKPEQKYTVKDKALYDKKDNTKVDLKSKAPKKHLYTSKQMQQQFVKDNLPDKVDVNKDRTLDVGVTEESGDMKLEAKNTVPSISFLKNIMPEVVPDKYVNWGVYPDIEEGDRVVAFHLDDSMRTYLKSELGIETDADAYVMGYDDNLNPVSYFAKEDAKGDLKKITDVTDDNKEKVQNHLPDADADDNPGMKDLDAQLYDNAVKDLRGKYTSFQTFLTDYNFSDVEELAEMVEDLYGLMEDYEIDENKNISKLGDVIKNKDKYEKIWNNITTKYADHNITDEASLYSFVDDLLNQSKNLKDFLERHNATGIPDVDAKIEYLNENVTTLQNRLQDIFDEYDNVSNEAELHDYVQGLKDDIDDLKDEIADLEDEIQTLGRPFMAQRFIDVSYSTVITLNKLEEAHELIGLDQYDVNLSNESQLKKFESLNLQNQDKLMEEWEKAGVTHLALQDTVNERNESRKNKSNEDSAVIVAFKGDPEDSGHVFGAYAVREGEWIRIDEVYGDQ